MTVSRRHLLAFATLVPATLLIAPRAMAATPEVYTENAIAIDGSDPVAYFTQRAPVPGDAAITVAHGGATWRFATLGNRDAFLADPTAYIPQYGGYCAYALSQGYIAPTVPEAWNIVDDKLYLNFSLAVRDRWARDIPGHIMAADANWPGILS